MVDNQKRKAEYKAQIVYALLALGATVELNETRNTGDAPDIKKINGEWTHLAFSMRKDDKWVVEVGHREWREKKRGLEPYEIANALLLRAKATRAARLETEALDTKKKRAVKAQKAANDELAMLRTRFNNVTCSPTYDGNLQIVLTCDPTMALAAISVLARGNVTLDEAFEASPVLISTKED